MQIVLINEIDTVISDERVLKFIRMWDVIIRLGSGKFMTNSWRMIACEA
jgi:hypothetical protein